MFDEEKFDKECKMLREYSEGLDKGIESERNRIKNEIKQAIENGIIKIDYGADNLFKIINWIIKGNTNIILNRRFGKDEKYEM